jgi:hypothetical protein
MRNTVITYNLSHFIGILSWFGDCAHILTRLHFRSEKLFWSRYIKKKNTFSIFLFIIGGCASPSPLRGAARCLFKGGESFPGLFSRAGPPPRHGEQSGPRALHVASAPAGPIAPQPQAFASPPHLFFFLPPSCFFMSSHFTRATAAASLSLVVWPSLLPHPWRHCPRFYKHKH